MSVETQAPVYYDGQKYREGRDMVIGVVRTIRTSRISTPVQDAILGLISRAVRGTLQSAEAVYETMTQEDADKGNHSGVLGRESDLATDKELLQKLADKVKEGL